MKNEEIIKRIEMLCKENGISINKLLSNCNLNKSIVDNLKKGSKPAIDKIQKIAEYFDVSTDYLLCRSDIKTSNQNPDEIQVAFSSGFAGLNDENKKTAMDIIAGLKAKQDLEEKK